MSTSTHTLTFPGAMTERGFWLYVWRIKSPIGELLYVGRTGDSSSPYASSPFARMGQHLGNNKNQNMVRQHLEKCGVQPEKCASFDLIAHGPLFPEAPDRIKHRKPRNIVAALEKELAETLEHEGYKVLNNVKSRQALDTDLWDEVRAAFAVHFPKLGRASEQ